MTIRDKLTNVSELIEFWNALMPSCPPPPQRTFFLWCAHFNEHAVQRGIERAAAKNHQCPALTGEGLARYATGVMKHITTEAEKCD